MRSQLEKRGLSTSIFLLTWGFLCMDVVITRSKVASGGRGAKFGITARALGLNFELTKLSLLGIERLTGFFISISFGVALRFG